MTYYQAEENLNCIDIPAMPCHNSFMARPGPLVNLPVNLLRRRIPLAGIAAEIGGFFMEGDMMRLTVTLNDGRTLSGVYDYLSCLARIDFARNLPDFLDFTITEAA